MCIYIYIYVFVCVPVCIYICAKKEHTVLKRSKIEKGLAYNSDDYHISIYIIEGKVVHEIEILNSIGYLNIITTELWYFSTYMHVIVYAHRLAVPCICPFLFLIRDIDLSLWIVGNMVTNFPDSKVHGANMGPIWGRQDPDGPHVGPMNFAIWVTLLLCFAFLRAGL